MTTTIELTQTELEILLVLTCEEAQRELPEHHTFYQLERSKLTLKLAQKIDKTISQEATK